MDPVSSLEGNWVSIWYSAAGAGGSKGMSTTSKVKGNSNGTTHAGIAAERSKEQAEPVCAVTFYLLLFTNCQPPVSTGVAGQLGAGRVLPSTMGFILDPWNMVAFGRHHQPPSHKLLAIKQPLSSVGSLRQ